MLDIRPFRGTTYNLDIVRDLSRVVAPPYDCISNALLKDLYGRSPWNSVRLIAGKAALIEEDPTVGQGDGSTGELPVDADPYRRTAHLWQEWQRTGVLVQDEKPAFYACREVYRSYLGEEETRTGFIGLVRLLDFSEGAIRPHELTLSAPKADRLRLFEECRANFSQIFTIYADEDRRTDSMLSSVTAGKPPDMSARDDDGSLREVWRLSDPSVVAQISKAMAGQRLAIADGHHRYETALNYSRQMRMRGERGSGQDATFGHDYTMIYMANAYSPGLCIAPVYRVVSGLPDFDRRVWGRRVSQDLGAARTPMDLSSCLRWLRADGAGQRRFVAYLGGGESITLALDRADGCLDVSVLHEAVIERTLGIGSEDLASQRYLTYTHDPGEAARAVDEGRAQLAFLLNPVRPEEILRVVDAGDIMPQKSTYFYPKLLTGLVINRLDRPEQ